MELQEQKIETRKEETDLNVLIETISNGKAILFTGAGFSSGAESVIGANPKGSRELSRLIALEAGIPESDNLMFTSDYYLQEKSSAELIQLLKENYELRGVANTHNSICSLPWRRCYTTNYDNSLELAFKNNGVLSETVDLEQPFDEYYHRNSKLCVHLNGSINSLTEETLNNRFKLSQSSYASPESFIRSDWYYCFKRDLERASAIVFIGYSLYDIDIQRVLFQSPDLMEKTFFITSENPSLETEFLLSKFGKCLPIGVSGFAQKIDSFYQNFSSSEEQYELQAFSKYELSEKQESITDSNVENLLLYGTLDDSQVDAFLLDDVKIPFIVKRSSVELARKAFDLDRNLVIYGGLGNGKSIILKIIKTIFTATSVDVYELDDPDADIIGDLDFLSNKNKKSIILVDDYSKNFSVIEHFARARIANLILIATARIADHEYYRDKLNDVRFTYDEENIDNLNSDEVFELIDILDNIGSWGFRAGDSRSGKATYIRNEFDNQLSLVLLSILNSPQIKQRVISLVKVFNKDKKLKDALFALCLCKVMNVPVTKSLLSEIADESTIYSPEFLKIPELSQLFKYECGEFKNSSSILSILLIKENFTASYVTNMLLKIAKRFDKFLRRDVVQDSVFKSMLKFSFVERILPNTTKVGNMNSYYESLKIEIPWLRKESHFWLQYAMSCIGFKKFDKAQQYLDQAYSIAHKKIANKVDYDTGNIDTQQARLWLSQCVNVSDGKIVFSHFLSAHKLLSSLKVDIYTLRQIIRYKAFYDDNFRKLSKADKREFNHLCSLLKSKLEAVVDNDMEYSGKHTLQRAITTLESVIL